MGSTQNYLASGSAASRQGRGAYSIVQLLLAVLGHAALTVAVPTARAFAYFSASAEGEDEGKSSDDPGLYIYLGTALALVLLGGAFAGLTIALMGQDEIYLQVIATSGEGAEMRNAIKVLRLLKRGKHWVLVTLLVGNVITNETLPIVLDRSIGGGYAAAISSTVLVIIFGEIVPQSVCVRFGLPIGAWMSPFVLVLMWIFAPISWPIAKLLDYLLGEDHGTTYKKAGLKTLVTLHKTIGAAPGERLNQDEVSIISGVLDLKAKSVGSIMTPMEDVFTLSADAVLDEDMIYLIMREGYSRIPIHKPDNEYDFVGMLLVKMLITYDPEDAKKVIDFALATLPETRPETSCLDIINFFQAGKSHMVLVSDFPGDTYGALGVVTLEDVIEELIGEEIIDESDVFIDVHKAIRRMQPAPIQRPRVPQGEIVTDPPTLGADEDALIGENGETNAKADRADSFGADMIKRTSTVSADHTNSQKPATYWLRRRSSQSDAGDNKRIPLNAHTRDQLRSLGPSNAASRPKATRISTVKIKPGVGTIPEDRPLRAGSVVSAITAPDLSHSAQSGMEHDSVRPGRSAKDGVRAVQVRYGSWDGSSPWQGHQRSVSAGEANGDATQSQEADTSAPNNEERGTSQPAVKVGRSNSHSTLGSMHSLTKSDDEGNDAVHYRRRASSQRGTTRSGSITEQFVDSGGVKKLVLEMTSSSSDAEDGPSGKGKENNAWLKPETPNKSRASSQRSGVGEHSENEKHDGEHGEKKKKRKRRPHHKKHKKKDEHHDGDGNGHGRDTEKTPLLSGR